jgi:formate dehydrogenase subunit gamma
MNQPNGWDAERARHLIEEGKNTSQALLPILHALQDEFGYIDNATVPVIARALNITQAQVHSTIRFYPDFRHLPPGRHVLKICRAEACHATGCEELVQHIENRLDIRLGETTADDTFTVEQIFCLGFCSASPAAMLDGNAYGRLTPQMVDSLLDNAGRPV